MAAKQVQIRLDDEDLERLDAIREQYLLTRTEVVRSLLRDPLMARVVARYARATAR